MSGQIRTAGWRPLSGCTKNASAVPSCVSIFTRPDVVPATADCVDDLSSLAQPGTHSAAAALAHSALNSRLPSRFSDSNRLMSSSVDSSHMAGALSPKGSTRCAQDSGEIDDALDDQ